MDRPPLVLVLLGVTAAAVALWALTTSHSLDKKQKKKKSVLAAAPSVPPPVAVTVPVRAASPKLPLLTADILLSVEAIMRHVLQLRDAQSSSSSSVNVLMEQARALSLPSGEDELTRQRVKFILSVLRLAQPALEQDIRQLPGQILGRIVPPFNKITKHYAAQALEWARRNQDLGVFLPVAFGLHSGLHLAGGAEISTLPLESDGNALLLLPSSKLLLVGNEDHSITAVNMDNNNNKQEYVIRTHADQITCLAVAAADGGGVFVAGSADGRMAVYRQSTGELVQWLEAGGHSARITALHFAGGLLFSASYDKTVRVWEAFALKAVLRPLEDEDWITSMCATTDEDGGGYVFCGTDVGTLHVWRNLLHVGKVHEAHESDVSCMTTIQVQQLQLLATGSWDETVKLWTFALEPVRTLVGHTDWVTSLAWQSSSPGVLFSGSRDCHIRVWSLEEGGEEESRVLTGHSSTVSALAADGGELLHSASSHVRTFEWKNSICNTTTSSTGGDLGHQLDVLCAAATKDLAVCVTGGKDGLVLIWDTEVEALSSQQQRNVAVGVLEGHTGWVNALCFADGKQQPDEFLVSGSGDHTVRVWDWNGTGECLFVLEAHEHWVTSVRMVVVDSSSLCESVDFEGKKCYWDVHQGRRVEKEEEEEEQQQETVDKWFGAQVRYTRDMAETEDDVVDESRVSLCSKRKLVLAPRGKTLEAWQVFSGSG